MKEQGKLDQYFRDRMVCSYSDAFALLKVGDANYFQARNYLNDTINTFQTFGF